MDPYQKINHNSELFSNSPRKKHLMRLVQKNQIHLNKWQIGHKIVNKTLATNCAQS
jgi:hypothetical protein